MYLKKSKIPRYYSTRGYYLQIYESYYNKQKKSASSRCIKTIGFEKDLIKKGISDPIKHCECIAKEMTEENNNKKKADNTEKIDKSPIKNLGYFIFKNILNGLDLKKKFALLQLQKSYRFSVYDVLEATILSRFVEPCSKYKTRHEIIPRLFEKYKFSYDQFLDGLNFLGQEYNKVIEIFNDKISENYRWDTSSTYFDGTNFYFEIDCEDGFRMKGPGKENRPLPLVSMGLLLDKNQIPLGLNMFAGNESEKPAMRDLISKLKSSNNINGKTITVADKGLNCAKNIYEAIKVNDGYIFSKSIKQLPQKELVWIFNENNTWTDVIDESGTIKYSYIDCVSDFEYKIPNQNLKFLSTEKRIVTFNPSLQKKQLKEINRMVEKAKNMCTWKAKKIEFGESGKYVNFETDGKDKVGVKLNHDKINKDKKIAGYNMIVTSEIDMSVNEIYDSYHHLWRIEESFKIMKSELDGRPVFVQDKYTIIGHFLSCYLCVLLERLLEFVILDNNFNYKDIISMCRKLNLVKEKPTRYINIAAQTDLIKYLNSKLNIPIDNYHIETKDINKILKQKLKIRKLI